MLIRPLNTLIFLAIAFLSAPTDLSAQDHQIKISTEEEVNKSLQLVPCKNSERLVAVEKLFRSSGATDKDISIVEKKGTKNLVVTKKGSGSGFVVVGAHYDKAGDGCGALDNWTGIVAIAHLYRTLANAPLTKTFKFVAFDKEEIGLVGSRAFVDELPKNDRAQYCAMVNLDSFGFAQPQVMANTSTPKLSEAAEAFWKQMKIELSVAAIPGAGADSASFVGAGIPAITFHGMTNDWPKYLHSGSDKLSNVKPKSVFLGYRLVLPFLAEIDKSSCDAFRKK